MVQSLSPVTQVTLHARRKRSSDLGHHQWYLRRQSPPGSAVPFIEGESGDIPGAHGSHVADRPCGSGAKACDKDDHPVLTGASAQRHAVGMGKLVGDPLVMFVYRLHQHDQERDGSENDPCSVDELGD